jgi:phosphatidylserine/phosphatidylglycerophosphate/cardiolipin synthase-like enzyme
MVSVGSTNFDLRSFRLNDEASLNVYDAAFAARMTEVFERTSSHAALHLRDVGAAAHEGEVHRELRAAHQVAVVDSALVPPHGPCSDPSQRACLAVR